MYHVIRRLSDGAVMDCRPETIGIKDVLHNQVLVNHGGTAEDYEITTSETPVEVTDLRTPEQIAAQEKADLLTKKRALVMHQSQRDQADKMGMADLVQEFDQEITAIQAEIAPLEK